VVAVLSFAVADLPGSQLGAATGGGKILIDKNAAGFGWFVDATPHDDIEFQRRHGSNERRAAPASDAVDRADLLTVVMHEMGHLLGLEHATSSSARDVMAETIGLGIRRTPTTSDAMMVELLMYRPQTGRSRH